MINIVEFLMDKYPLKATYNSDMENILIMSFENEISENEFLKGYKNEDFFSHVVNNCSEPTNARIGNILPLKPWYEKVQKAKTIGEVVAIYDELSELDIYVGVDGLIYDKVFVGESL